MQARARVLRVENELAWLEMSENAGGCGRCDEPGGCRSVQLAHAFGGAEKVFALPMSVPVKPGDKVVISIPDGAPLSAALAAYGLATVLLLVGAAIGSYFQRRTAFIASRSKIRAGCERSTRALVTEPSVPTVISISTSPAVPARSASAG